MTVQIQNQMNLADQEQKVRRVLKFPIDQLMMRFMQCPKCPGNLTAAKTQKNATYHWCSYCKGLWLQRSELLKIFDLPQFSQKLQNLKLEKKMKTSFQCPDCQDHLQVGKVQAADLEMDECESCDSFFLDDKEINRLFSSLSEPTLPQAKSPQISKEKVQKLDINCPVCVDQPLWGSVQNPQQFRVCLQCEGIQTTVEALKKVASRSLFSPAMFTFRPSQGVISICRYCQQEQEFGRKDCVKCGRQLKRINCTGCNGQMGEYSLNDITIERCQVCNFVWLDKGEFEKVMTAFPDLRKVYEEGRRRGELLETEVRAASQVYAQGIEETTRDLAIRFWGIYGVIFFEGWR